MAWPFLEPVDPNDAPDYYGIIKEPMGKSFCLLLLCDQKYFVNYNILFGYVHFC